jgi:F-type H+-transporting ATPase subunit delta
MTSTVGRNYARALFELGREASVLDEVEADIRAARDTLYADRAVRDFLGNRLIGRTTKKAVIRAGLEGKVDERVLSLLCLLADRGRVRLLGEITEELERLARLARGVRRVRIATAFALDAGEKEQVVRSLEARYGGRVDLEIEVHPSLIGGMLAESEGQEIELSLEGSLKDLREGLSGRTGKGKG